MISPNIYDFSILVPFHISFGHLVYLLTILDIANVVVEVDLGNPSVHLDDRLEKHCCLICQTIAAEIDHVQCLVTHETFDKLLATLIGDAVICKV